MPWSNLHLSWLCNISSNVTSEDGVPIALYDLIHVDDANILDAWAKHIRNHYILDTEIDRMRKGTNLSRSDFLLKLKFPDASAAPGPSIRAGDFAEILVADYVSNKLEFWVPRVVRYANKDIRNESTKGCDVIGFGIKGEASFKKDTLAIFETKAQFSGRQAKSRLQNAIDDSAKDILRRAESLNAIKQRLYDLSQDSNAEKIERFQNLVDHPYEEMFGAVAVYCKSVYDESALTSSVAKEHPEPSKLRLIVIKGREMMPLVHSLYLRAANGA